MIFIYFYNSFISGQEDTAEFFAEHRLHVIASLPCYTAKNVNTQRGKGVFDRSIHALVKLNELGFGKPDSGLNLDLVYNPLGRILYLYLLLKFITYK